jgi:hypothetical protein
MVYLAVYFGFSSALGAFVMGSILSETGIIERIEHIIKPLKDFFGAVFFVTVGMMVNPQMFITYAYPIGVITLVVLIGMVVFSIFGLVISGQNLKTAVSCGFSLAQVGEFAFIIATLGMSLHVLDDFVYPIIVAVSVITTFLTPIMIKSAGRAQKIIENILPEKWLTYINQNAKSRSKDKTEDKLWLDLFKSMFIRLFIFSFILTAIIVCVNLWIRPYALKWLPNILARLLTTIITLLLMSPFLKGLVGWNNLPSGKIKTFFDKITIPEKIKELQPKIKLLRNNQTPNSENIVKKHVFMMPQHLKTVIKENTDSVKNIISKDRISRIYTDLWFANKTNRVALLIFTSFRMLIVSFFIVTTVHLFLTENPKVIFLLLLATIWMIMRSKWLLNQYIKIESRFLDNLNGEDEISEIEENPE